MDSTMFTGFGIRTLSSDNGTYFPTRYHGGSVWSHDTAFVMRQAMRAGFTSEARQIARSLVRAAQGFDWRLPNCSRGIRRLPCSSRCPIPRRVARRHGLRRAPFRSPRRSGCFPHETRA